MNAIDLDAEARALSTVADAVTPRWTGTSDLLLRLPLELRWRGLELLGALRKAGAVTRRKHGDGYQWSGSGTWYPAPVRLAPSTPAERRKALMDRMAPRKAARS